MPKYSTYYQVPSSLDFPFKQPDMETTSCDFYSDLGKTPVVQRWCDTKDSTFSCTPRLLHGYVPGPFSACATPGDVSMQVTRGAKIDYSHTLTAPSSKHAQELMPLYSTIRSQQLASPQTTTDQLHKLDTADKKVKKTVRFSPVAERYVYTQPEGVNSNKSLFRK